MQVEKEQLLKITAISERKKDKNGREYVVVSLKPVRQFMGKEVISSGKDRTRVLWDKTELEGGKTIPATPLFLSYLKGELKVGDIITGQIVTFDTTPYNLGGKDITSFTTVVFEGENPITVANNQLKQQKASTVVDGAVTAPENLENNKLVEQTES